MISYSEFDEKIISNILNVRHHEDANTVLLADNSLNHDMNAMIGWIRRSCPNMEEYYNMDFSEAVHALVYKDHKDICDMAMQARKASLYFARMADILQSSNKWYFTEKEKENAE